MKRRYFVTARTEHEPPGVLGRRIDAENFAEALAITEAEAKQLFPGKAYRVTSITEEPVVRDFDRLALAVHLGGERR